jgi:hypothetical protein
LRPDGWADPGGLPGDVRRGTLAGA